MQSQIGRIIYKTGNDEKNISAIKKKKGKQTWLQGKDVNSEWQKGSFSPSGKRKKKTYCLLRAQAEIIKV